MCVFQGSSWIYSGGAISRWHNHITGAYHVMREATVTQTSRRVNILRACLVNFIIISTKTRVGNGCSEFWVLGTAGRDGVADCAVLLLEAAIETIEDTMTLTSINALPSAPYLNYLGYSLHWSLRISVMSSLRARHVLI